MENSETTPSQHEAKLDLMLADYRLREPLLQVVLTNGEKRDEAMRVCVRTAAVIAEELDLSPIAIPLVIKKGVKQYLDAYNGYRERGYA